MEEQSKSYKKKSNRLQNVEKDSNIQFRSSITSTSIGADTRRNQRLGLLSTTSKRNQSRKQLTQMIKSTTKSQSFTTSLNRSFIITNQLAIGSVIRKSQTSQMSSIDSVIRKSQTSQMSFKESFKNS